MEHSGREFERNWQDTDNLVRREMDEILEEVNQQSRKGESETYPNVQRDDKGGGTRDADGKWVCGVLL